MIKAKCCSSTGVKLALRLHWTVQQRQLLQQSWQSWSWYCDSEDDDEEYFYDNTIYGIRQDYLRLLDLKPQLHQATPSHGGRDVSTDYLGSDAYYYYESDYHKSDVYYPETEPEHVYYPEPKLEHVYHPEPEDDVASNQAYDIMSVEPSRIVPTHDWPEEDDYHWDYDYTVELNDTSPELTGPKSEFIEPEVVYYPDSDDVHYPGSGSVYCPESEEFYHSDPDHVYEHEPEQHVYRPEPEQRHVDSPEPEPRHVYHPEPEHIFQSEPDHVYHPVRKNVRFEPEDVYYPAELEDVHSESEEPEHAYHPEPKHVYHPELEPEPVYHPELAPEHDYYFEPQDELSEVKPGSASDDNIQDIWPECGDDELNRGSGVTVTKSGRELGELVGVGQLPPGLVWLEPLPPDYDSGSEPQTDVSNTSTEFTATISPPAVDSHNSSFTHAQSQVYCPSTVEVLASGEVVQAPLDALVGDCLYDFVTLAHTEDVASVATVGAAPRPPAKPPDLLWF